MKFSTIVKAVAVLAVISLCFMGAAAGSSYVDATYNVKDLKISPSVLQPGEHGTVTVLLENAGTTPLKLSKALIRDSTGGTYSTETTLTSFGSAAAGQTTTLKFPITAKTNEGVFYPELYIEFSSDSGYSSYYTYMKYSFELIIDSNVFYTEITQRPDVFVPGEPAVLGLSLTNLRTSDDITAVQVSVSGTGVTANKESVLIGTIEPGKAGKAALTVTTAKETDSINIDVTYRTGNNWHTMTIPVPIAGTAVKRDADIVVNNLSLDTSAGYLYITGDANNAGLSTAKGMTVTVLDAETVQPYPTYAIGSLDADSLAGFEVTCIPDDGAQFITLLFSYKDDNGNTLVHEEMISLEDTALSLGQNTGGSPIVATVIIIILVVIIGALVIVICRRGKTADKKNE